MPASFQNKCLPITINSYEWGTQNRKNQGLAGCQLLPRALVHRSLSLRLRSSESGSCVWACGMRGPLKGRVQLSTAGCWPEGSLQEWSGPQRWELSEISRKMFYRKSTLPTLYLLNSSWQAHVIKYRVSCRLIHLRLATRSWQSQQNQPMGTGVWLNSHKLT